MLEVPLFYSAEVHSFGSWTGDNLYRSSTHSGAPAQMTSDDFFAHNKGGASSLVRRDSISPFLGLS